MLLNSESRIEDSAIFMGTRCPVILKSSPANATTLKWRLTKFFISFNHESNLSRNLSNTLKIWFVTKFLSRSVLCRYEPPRASNIRLPRSVNFTLNCRIKESNLFQNVNIFESAKIWYFTSSLGKNLLIYMFWIILKQPQLPEPDRRRPKMGTAPQCLHNRIGITKNLAHHHAGSGIVVDFREHAMPCLLLSGFPLDRALYWFVD